MISVCLPSDALLQHLPSYLGFSYLGHGVSLRGCSSKAQSLLLTLYEGYLLTATVPDLQRGIAPLGPPVPAQPAPWVAPPSCRPWPRARGGFSQPTLTSDAGCLLPASTVLGRGVAPPGRRPRPTTRGGSSRPFLRHHSLALWAAVPDFRRGVALGSA